MKLQLFKLRMKIPDLFFDCPPGAFQARFPGSAVADTAALLEACLGGRCDPAELDRLGTYLARLRLTNLEGGEA